MPRVRDRRIVDRATAAGELHLLLHDTKLTRTHWNTIWCCRTEQHFLYIIDQ